MGRLDPPRAVTRAVVVAFQSRSGWVIFFNRILSLRDQSQFAEHTAESTLTTFSKLQSRQRRIPMPDGRSRARRRRGLILDTLRGYIECSLRWLQTGCLRLSEAPFGRSPRQLASRAAKLAARHLWSSLETSPVYGRCLRTS